MSPTSPILRKSRAPLPEMLLPRSSGGLRASVQDDSVTDVRYRRFILVALVIHLVFFASIFEIYFSSPLVHGASPHAAPGPAPARRLVLLVADGLRADSIYRPVSVGQSRAPYLRRVMEELGSWGISHTRVPTESRPGHVALIAGFYEDVGAVAKGWQENPVEFDSVFNESRFTWSWGSPDILPMFAKGASGDHVHTFSYDAKKEDFASKDASKLDTWVFDHVKSFLKDASSNEKLAAQLSQDKIVFFLHLLGLDTNGHAHRPASREYLDNIASVDHGIGEIVSIIEDYFGNDKKTAYVFTSDHGMTDWGSHGAGHLSETLTPLIAWGAGVNRPHPPGGQIHTDTYSQDWGLGHLNRMDVNQADVAPLMTSLLGIPFPLNSVGVLPLGYLNNSELFKAENIFANAQAILEQFQLKMNQKKETLSPFFTPYKPLSDSTWQDLLAVARTHIGQRRFQEAVSACRGLIDVALDGLRYYHTYDRAFLGTSVAFGFLGWISYVVLLVLRKHTGVLTPSSAGTAHRDTHAASALAVGAAVVVLLLLKFSPWTHYVYCLLPVATWGAATQSMEDWRKVMTTLRLCGLKSLLGGLLLSVSGIEIMVLSFFYREMLSVELVALAVWPFTTVLWTKDKLVSGSWSLACLLLAIHPLLPVVGRDANISLVVLAGALTILLSALLMLALHRVLKTSDFSWWQTATCLTQMCSVAMSVYIVNSTHGSLAAKEGLPLFNQITSWATLGSSLLVPMLSPTLVIHRLLSVYLAFMSPYLLMSTSHEALFTLSLEGLMLAWVCVEARTARLQGLAPRGELSKMDFASSAFDTWRHLKLDDIRRGYFFVFFIISAFFGTGNIASINSFDPASVYCFTTVFSPFVMGALMMWKILIPFIVVMCAFEAVQDCTRLSSKSLFLIVLILSDIMAVHFFFLVQDYGSWLDIGTSISHFVIVMLTTIFLMLLNGLAHILTRKCIAFHNHHVKIL
ncbi:GPI ethanolamine phosphate transferase 1 isoform X1 [Petromyzon marinus]|uniref:GPI ethanolamine phosphate transferase 1 isoform X1 n=2 Tax=Petromyzon marinus TaxID=7757 RepID=UPI003F6F425B